MARVIINGEEYEIPDNEVELARTQYGAMPADSGSTASRITAGAEPNILREAAGAVSGAIGAIPKPVLYGGAGLGGLIGAGKYLVGKVRGAQAAPKAPAPAKGAAASRATGKASSSLVKLTKADIKAHDEFRNFKPGQEVRRATYEKVKMAPTPRKENPRIVAEQEARVEATQGMKPRTRGGRIVGEPAGGVEARAGVPRGTSQIPVRPITVEGEPRFAPAQTENPRYTGGRGASGPELARRAADRQAFLEGRPPYGPRPALAAEEAAALRTAPIADPELWATRGISAPPGKFAGLRGAAPGALQVILGLLDAQSIPQQLEQAQEMVDERAARRMFPFSPPDVALERYRALSPKGI